MVKNYSPYSVPANRGVNNPAPQPTTVQTAAPAPKRGIPVPEDYVSAAEKVIENLKGIIYLDKNDKKGLTTSKLRNLYSSYCDLYNEIRRQAGPLTPAQMDAITVARIRIIYESGRDKDVLSFTKEAHLNEYLLWIGDSTENFIKFYHYFEALVAYHRFNIATAKKEGNNYVDKN